MVLGIRSNLVPTVHRYSGLREAYNIGITNELCTSDLRFTRDLLEFITIHSFYGLQAVIDTLSSLLGLVVFNLIPSPCWKTRIS